MTDLRRVLKQVVRNTLWRIWDWSCYYGRFAPFDWPVYKINRAVFRALGGKHG